MLLSSVRGDELGRDTLPDPRNPGPGPASRVMDVLVPWQAGHLSWGGRCDGQAAPQAAQSGGLWELGDGKVRSTGGV